MTPQEFYRIRKALGFTTTQMATHLNLPNPSVSGRNTITRYEKGYQVTGIPGPVAVAMRALEKGYRGDCGLCKFEATEEITTRCQSQQCPFQKKAQQ